LSFELRLKYLFDHPNLNARQARWLEFLCEFEFDIKYVKDKENNVVDALSKKFHITTISICKTDLRMRVLGSNSPNAFYL
jgi:ribosome maturation protein Sdo1